MTSSGLWGRLTNVSERGGHEFTLSITFGARAAVAELTRVRANAPNPNSGEFGYGGENAG
jgi:hypothetical protein